MFPRGLFSEMTGIAMERYYTSQEMAKIGGAGCEGCGACCRDMGDSVRLDPLDVHELSLHLSCSVADLVDQMIGLHAEDGVILPHLLMTVPDGAGEPSLASADAPPRMPAGEPRCVFLQDDGRCSVHLFRPGLCRLFPLGRDYDGTYFRYFVVKGGCPLPGRTKVRIDKWLGVSDIKAYEKFISDWHYFIKELKEKISRIPDPDEIRSLNLQLLETFYVTPYDPMRSFYNQFGMRLIRARRTML